MSGAQYEPNDSRDVTLKRNEPGKPSNWRADEAGQQDRGEMEPDDTRNVHGTGAEAGEKTGWREAEGKSGDGAPEPRAEEEAAKTPEGVKQDHPFSVSEAVQAADHLR